MVDLAHGCLLMRRARVLSVWVGSGKPVTAKGVLRRADVGPAALALGLPPPGRVRTAADVWAIHRPWVAAEAAGLLAVGLDRAVAAVPDEQDPAAQWLAGLRAVLRAESVDQRRIGATVMCRAVLHVLDAESVPDVHHLEDAVERVGPGHGYRAAEPDPSESTCTLTASVHDDEASRHHQAQRPRPAEHDDGDGDGDETGAGRRLACAVLAGASMIGEDCGCRSSVFFADREKAGSLRCPYVPDPREL